MEEERALEPLFNAQRSTLNVQRSMEEESLGAFKVRVTI
jgi:hypothetical protein